VCVENKRHLLVGVPVGKPRVVFQALLQLERGDGRHRKSLRSRERFLAVSPQTRLLPEVFHLLAAGDESGLVVLYPPEVHRLRLG